MSVHQNLGIIESLSATSVRIGSLFIPANSVESSLTRYSRQIFLVNESVEFPYSIRGTGTAVKYRDQHFVFCCQHQFKDSQPDQVAVICRREKNFLLHGSNLKVPTQNIDNIDEDYIDACGFKFEIPSYDIQNLSSDFFPLNDDSTWPNFSRNKLIIIGYPYCEQQMYTDTGIHPRVVIVGGEYLNASAAQYVHVLKLQRKRQFNSDGLSGGPVFYVGENNQEYFIGLAGMIARGGSDSDHCYFIEAELLKYFCDQAIK